MKANKELQLLVAKNSDFQFLSNGKIKCILTRHEFNPTLEEFQNHVKGKSYTNALDGTFDYTQFEPYIIAHKKDSTKLFCVLTKQIINKKKRPILDHVNGKRYRLSLQKYLQLTQEEEEKKYNYQPKQKEELDEQHQNGLDDEVEDDAPVKKVKVNVVDGAPQKQKNINKVQVYKEGKYNGSAVLKVKEGQNKGKISTKVVESQSKGKVPAKVSEAKIKGKVATKVVVTQNNGKVQNPIKKEPKISEVPQVKKKILKKKVKQ